MIRTENLSFTYSNTQEIFKFPDISLSEQDNLLVLGKSGIGKTTLLHLLAGLIKPLSGKIFIDDTDLNSMSSQKIDKFRGQHIGIVFQKHHAIRSLSVFDNLKARLYFSKSTKPCSAVDDLLEDLGLTDLKHRQIQELSEGQLQRLGIGMAVVHSPRLILADEPTSSLDDYNCSRVIDLLFKQAQKTKANLVLITHDSRIKSYFVNSITL